MEGSAHRRLRLVLDAYVVVAGLLWKGPPRRLIVWPLRARRSSFTAARCCSMSWRIRWAIRSSRRASSVSPPAAAALVAQYTALVWLVAPASVPRIVANDADDDHVIAAAVAARAELIVTGDRKHLLPIGTHQGIAIVTAREVVDRLDARLKV